MSVTTGTLAVPEGIVFYSLTTPASGGADRPPLLFLHAGVTDYHLWDTTIAHASAAGWTCLALDRFGFGQSLPSKGFLESNPRPLVQHLDHWALAVNALLKGRPVIVVGCSMGGAGALELTLQHPELVAGFVSVTGGVPGFEFSQPEGEMKLLKEHDRLTKAKDIDGLARWNAHYWGDGPLQPEGRASQEVRDKLYTWNTLICHAEVRGDGGDSLAAAQTENVLGRLGEIKVPTAIAWGEFDESHVNEGLKHLAKEIQGAEIQSFTAAHLPSLELPNDFNSWLEHYLQKHFLK